MTRYGKFMMGLTGVWLAFSIAASAWHLYSTGAEQPPLAMGIAATAPILAFLVWLAASARFRAFALALNPRVLTLVQSWRLAGFVFLVLAAYDILPRTFALSAGWGDITIGATAALAALKLADGRHRTGFIVWQILGIADLVMAVLLGTLSGVVEPHGISTQAMTVLPMSLIPTFAVPLFLILHLICIAQARRWPVQSVERAGQQLSSRAA